MDYITKKRCCPLIYFDIRIALLYYLEKLQRPVLIRNAYTPDTSVFNKILFHFNLVVLVFHPNLLYLRNRTRL